MHVPLAALPWPYRALMDPGIPLPDDVDLVPRRGPSISLWRLFVGCGLSAVSAVLAVRSLRYVYEGHSDPTWLALGVVMLGLGGQAALATWHEVRAAFAFRAQRRAGRWRYGMFILRDALLIRLSDEDGSVIPRGDLVEARWQPRSASPAAQLTVAFVGMGGAVQEIRLACDDLDADGALLAEGLTLWRDLAARPARGPSQA